MLLPPPCQLRGVPAGISVGPCGGGRPLLWAELSPLKRRVEILIPVPESDLIWWGLLTEVTELNKLVGRPGSHRTNTGEKPRSPGTARMPEAIATWPGSPAASEGQPRNTSISAWPPELWEDSFAL